MRRGFGRAASVWSGVVLVLAVQGQFGRAQTPVRFDTHHPVYIGYDQTACAYFCHYRFRYEPLPTPRLFVLEHAESQTLTDAGRESTPLPPVVLDAAQVRKIEGLLRFYRANHGQGSSTASEALRFAYSEGGEKSESFVVLDERVKELEDADPRDLAVLRENGLPYADAGPVLSLRRVVEAAEAAAALGEVAAAYPEPAREDTKGFAIARSLERVRRATADAAKALKKLDGWAKAHERFLTERVHAPDLQKGGRLYVGLVARQPNTAPIDRLRWHNPLSEGRPMHNWRRALRAHDEAAAIVTRLPWIGRWRAAAPGRSVELTLTGGALGFVDWERTDVDKAWRHAGMRGQPYCSLGLNQEGRPEMLLLIGVEERRALLIRGEPTPPAERRSDHPLDSLSETVRRGRAEMVSIGLPFASTWVDYCVVAETGVPGSGRRMD